MGPLARCTLGQCSPVYESLSEAAHFSMLSLAAPGNQAMGSSTHVQNKSSEDSSKHSIIVMVSFYIKNNLIFKILPKKKKTMHTWRFTCLPS